MSKKELVILSDLWGSKQSEWLALFKALLSPKFDITFFDACKLGAVDTSLYSEDHLHRQFVDFGIETAVNNLLKLTHSPKIYIGCSIGGTIAWQAALKGLPVERLITISSTRLRKETTKPDCQMQLYFGKDDPYQPSLSWYKRMSIENFQILDGGHNIYKNIISLEKIVKMSFFK